jgi:DnaK suppressor protein
VTAVGWASVTMVSDQSTPPAEQDSVNAPDAHTPDTPPAGTAGSERTALDLDQVERDLAGVEAALRRLDDGTYWTDEVTGQPIPDEVLVADPVARRAP